MLNKAMIIGNICQDIELRHMPNGHAATTISVATNIKWKDKQSGEKKESVEYHRVALFDRSAEVAGEYLKKGSKVYIEGRLRTQKWTDQQGVDHYTTEIVAERLLMLDSKPQGYDQTHPASQHQQAPSHDNFDAPYNDDIAF